MGPPALLGAQRDALRPAVRGRLPAGSRRGPRRHHAAHAPHRRHQRPQPDGRRGGRRATWTRSAGSPKRHGARVLVDEVYLDTAACAAGAGRPRRASPVFISTNSLTKSYGLAGLRCGWVIARPGGGRGACAARATSWTAPGPFPTERLSVLAFSHARPAGGAGAADPRRPTAAPFARSSRPGRSSSACCRQAGTVVFPRIRGVEDAGPFVERLARDFDTDVVPGRFFQAPAHFRIAFGGTARRCWPRASRCWGRRSTRDEPASARAGAASPVQQAADRAVGRQLPATARLTDGLLSAACCPLHSPYFAANA